jgi:hypothetical protein
LIIILKRDDLPPEHRRRAVEELELNHVKLSPELSEQAELIAFIEGDAAKFLKHRQDIQSKHSVDVLLSYITSTAPITKDRIPFSMKRSRPWRKKEGTPR